VASRGHWTSSKHDQLYW